MLTLTLPPLAIVIVDCSNCGGTIDHTSTGHACGVCGNACHTEAPDHD